MENTAPRETIARLKAFYETGATRDPGFRVRMLKKLAGAIRAAEPDIMNALREDLRKSQFESYASEIGILYPEIKYAAKNQIGRASCRERV